MWMKLEKQVIKLKFYSLAAAEDTGITDKAQVGIFIDDIDETFDVT